MFSMFMYDLITDRDRGRVQDQGQHRRWSHLDPHDRNPSREQCRLQQGLHFHGEISAPKSESISLVVGHGCFMIKMLPSLG